MTKMLGIVVLLCTVAAACGSSNTPDAVPAAVTEPPVTTDPDPQPADTAAPLPVTEPDASQDPDTPPPDTTTTTTPTEPATEPGATGEPNTQGPVASREPSELEELEPSQAGPTPTPEVIVTSALAPKWPFRGLIEGNFFEDSDNDRRGVVLRYHSSRDRTTTEIVVPGVSPSSSFCWSVHFGTVSEAGVTINAGREVVDASGELAWEDVDVVVPWDEPARVVPPEEFSDGEGAWTDIMSAAYDADRGYVVGGTSFDVSIHANGVRVRAGEEAAGYVLADLAGIEEPPSEDLNLYGDITSSWDELLFLGTDGEFVAFGTWPYEPACGPQRQYLISLRTGEVVACRQSSDDLALVQPPNEGLLVENVALARTVWVGDQQCGHVSSRLTDLWSALPVPPDPYPPVATPPERDVLPADVAPPWPFRGAVLAFQRYDPEEFDYDIVLQYYSSEDGSATEIVFGSLRLRSQELVVEASEDGVEVSQAGWPAWRTDWRVEVPWGGSPERVAVDPDRVAPLPVEEYPTTIEFGSRRIEIDAFHVRDGGHVPVLATRLEVDGEQSWHVWSRPRDDLIDTDLEMTSELVYEFVWLRGTDDRTAAISRWQYPEICGWKCDPFLTYMVSFQTGEVLGCGFESSGHNALVFVSPGDVEPESEVVLPPSGWLDLDGAACKQRFEFAVAPGDGSGPIPTQTSIQADADRRRMLIQPTPGG